MPTQFSGHETFALRAGWPRKAFDAASENPAVFGDEGAIARFDRSVECNCGGRLWS